MSEPAPCAACGATTKEFRIVNSVDVGRACSDDCGHTLLARGVDDHNVYTGRS